LKVGVRKALVTLPLVSFLLLGIGSCGGGSNAPGSGGGAGGSSGQEYLWEFSSDPNLHIATIDTATGQLGAPTATGGIACNSDGTIPSIAVTPSNKFTFVIDKCFTSIHVYAMSGPGVVLKEIPESPYFTSNFLNSIAIDPEGKYLYVIATNPGGSILDQISVDGGTGELTLNSTTTLTGSFGQAVVDPHGKFLFANDVGDGKILAYSIGGNGTLSQVPGSPFPTSNQPFTLAIAPSAKFLYSIGGGSNNTIDAFTIDAETGALTSVPGSPFPAPASLSSLVVDASSGFLYATVQTASALPSASVLFGFSIDSSDGSLTALATSPYPAPSFPSDAVSLNIP